MFFGETKIEEIIAKLQLFDANPEQLFCTNLLDRLQVIPR